MRPRRSDSSTRVTYLESLRGIAALTVVLGHTLGASRLEGTPADIVLMAIHSPLACFINGRGAVIFFFTLSGYVLTLRALETNDMGAILHGAVKRWPRLAGPVLASTILSCLLWAGGCFFHTQASNLTGSDWLAHFAYGSLDLGNPPDMGLAAAIAQGAFTTFRNGTATFNASLWTMHYELIGSFAVFLTAALLIATRSRVAKAALFLSVFGFFAYRNILYVPFGVGLCLAVLRVGGWSAPRPRLAIPMVIGGLYAFGYQIGGTSYAWLPAYEPTSDAMTLAFSLASAAVLLGVGGWPSARAWLNHRVFQTIGSMSFHIYVVHLLVLMSAGCAAFVYIQPLWGFNAASAALIGVTWSGTAIVAGLLRAMDQY